MSPEPDAMGIAGTAGSGSAASPTPEARLEVDVQVAFEGFDFQVEQAIPAAGVTAVFGPSGSGKTTLLRSLLGFETRSSRPYRPERRRLARQRSRGRGAASPAPRRLHLPGRPPVPAPRCRGQPRLRGSAEHAGARRRGVDHPRRRRRRAGPGAAARPATRHAVGRRAPAGRTGTGPAQPAATAASRRAPVGARPAAQGRDHALPAGAAPAFRHPDPLRQPRGRRSGAAGRPRPGAGRRPGAGLWRHGRRCWSSSTWRRSRSASRLLPCSRLGSALTTTSTG